MLITRFLLPITYLVIISECKMKPFIVGGDKASITDFPYVAHLGTRCIDEKREYVLSWICGSSIVNQHVLLTAAHCVHGCFEDTVITISVGHEYKIENGVTTAYSFLIHENYDDLNLSNDIALVRVKNPLKFNETINRVALLKNPPYNEEALVAGWGLTNEESNEVSLILRYTQQYVWNIKDCLDLFEWIPNGTFCAENTNTSGFVAQGDSGSALVVQGYIQIGIVSGKDPDTSSSVSIFTDVAYFYEWIQNSTEKIICID